MEHANPNVLIVAQTAEEGATLQDRLQLYGLTVRIALNGSNALDLFYADPPQCLVFGHEIATDDGHSLLKDIKADNVYGHLPVILIIGEKDRDAGIDWSAMPADDYVVRPFPPAELASRILLCLARASRDVNANPLTGLPGNLT
ncbi:MAG TPA: response regulator, partial [Candidatus Hydrogenedentes bacterium]|nr:response regulator [Candidatus Hydrogenedentota bacterium]